MNFAKKSGTWHVPFAPAPVLAFQGNSEAFRGATAGNQWNYFSGWEWYDWNNRATQQTNCGLYSNYMPMHKHPLPHDYSDMGTSNIMPSNCAGRPALLFNEPSMDWTIDAGRNASDYARIVFYYRGWPGDLYCCGHVENTNRLWSSNIQGDSGNPQVPWFIHITNQYTSTWGGTGLPIDGVHMHIYTVGGHIDTTNNRIIDSPTQWRTLLKGKLNEWNTYLNANYGSNFPVKATEWGVLQHGVATTDRDSVRSGMVDIAKLAIDETLGSHITNMIWFWAWGTSGDWCESQYCYYPNRLIHWNGGTNYHTPSNPATLSSVGECLMDIIGKRAQNPPTWPSSGVCYTNGYSY